MIERDVSGFSGISTSTSLSLETIFEPNIPVYDPDREVPEKINIADYDEIWINVSTLVRNILSSIESKLYNSLKRNDVVSILLSELTTISSLFQTTNIKPNFYICDYKNIGFGRFGLMASLSIKLRNPTTPRAVMLRKLTEESLSKIVKEYEGIHMFGELFKLGTGGSKLLTKALIFTHYPYDLLNYNMFKELVLLESNTGKIKHRDTWNSKYYPVPSADMSNLPFNRKLLFIFGDKNMISPGPTQLRREVMRLSELKKWNPFTSEKSVMFDINAFIKDPLMVDYINSI